MFLLGSFDILQVLPMWIFILALSRFFHRNFAINSGHHFSEAIHEGDEIRSMDFGLFQLAAIADRIKDKSQFRILKMFSEHTLHHLFPTLDHCILPLLHETCAQVCKEFDAEMREFSSYHFYVGQFKQLARVEATSLC